MAENKRVVLTGATGFIGSALAKEILKRDYDLVVVSRNPVEAKHEIPDAKEYIEWQPQES